MDDDSQPDARFRSEFTTINHGSAPYAGAFFPRSQNFTFSGSTFISNNYNEPAVPPGFRTIPFGDINLMQEIRLRGQSGLVDRYRVRLSVSVRRMHSARIHGDNSDMTVAVYQGDNAEEEWRNHIAKYSSLCLMPWRDFLKLYHKSQILTVYMFACWDTDRAVRNMDVPVWVSPLLQEAGQYFQHMFGSYLHIESHTFWIRRSTGRLCADLTPNDVAAPEFYEFYDHAWIASSKFDNTPPLNDPNAEVMVIDSLELAEYHDVCCWELAAHPQFFLVSTPAELHMGAVVHSPSGSDLDGLVEIAFLPNPNLLLECWNSNNDLSEVIVDDWTRYKAGKMLGTTIIHYSIQLKNINRMAWFSQANHIFHQLHIKSNYEEYGIIVGIHFRLQILASTQTPPEGYLFLCPTGDLQTGPTTFQWPDCPAYWSLDPSGAERLSTDEATNLGFPALELEIEVEGLSWDDSGYAGLRKFHKAKGFDPDSQDVARHLGHQLFHLSRGMEPLFAHVDGEVSDVGTERESSSTVLTEHDDEDGSTPENECVSDPQQFSSLHSDAESAPQSWGWKAVTFIKLGLILSLGFGLLYEYGTGFLAQRDI